MIEYKVGNRIYATTDKNNGSFIGYAEITVVGRFYAEAVSVNGKLLRINMAKSRICYRSSVNYTIGDVYASKQAYDDECAVERFAEKIKSVVSRLGNNALRECSVGDLRKIAAILKINLDE